MGDQEGLFPRAPLISFPGGDPIYNENGPFLFLLNCFFTNCHSCLCGFGHFETLGPFLSRFPRPSPPNGSGIMFLACSPHGIHSNLREDFSSSTGYWYCAGNQPTPGSAAGEPSPRTGNHGELNPGPPDPQADVLPTELIGLVVERSWTVTSRLSVRENTGR